MHPVRVRWLVLMALGLSLASPAIAHPLLVGVVPDLPGSAGDGGIAIGLPPTDLGAGASGAVDLAGYKLTEGKHTWTIPSGPHVGPADDAWFIANASEWNAFDGPAPDATWDSLALTSAKGHVSLLDPSGQTIDTFVWGNTTFDGIPGLRYTSGGTVYERLAARTDTDSPRDWTTPRLHRIGESTLGTPEFTVDWVTLYASPDSSYMTLTTLIAGAQTRLQLHVYMLTNTGLVDALVAAKQAHPGLDLAVLADGAPVGLSGDDRHREADAFQRITDAGGHVVLASGGASRYAHHHLKVLVADDAVAVQSENWVDGGVPRDPSWGNRGWGVVLHDKAATDWMAGWMRSDREAWDAAPFVRSTFDPNFVAPLRTAPRTGEYGPATLSHDIHAPTHVRLVVTPDATGDPATDPVERLVREATRSVDSEQLEMNPKASNGLGYSTTDPFVDGLLTAASRGAKVRLLHAPPFGDDGDSATERAADLLQGRTGIQVAAGDRPGIATWHNKGILVDGRWAVVGSMNAVHASRSANREVDVILDSPEAAEYYGALFDSDWKPAAPGPDWSVPGTDVHGLGVAPLPILLVAMGVAALAVRKR